MFPALALGWGMASHVVDAAVSFHGLPWQITANRMAETTKMYFLTVQEVRSPKPKRPWDWCLLETVPCLSEAKASGCEHQSVACPGPVDLISPIPPPSPHDLFLCVCGLFCLL